LKALHNADIEYTNAQTHVKKKKKKKKKKKNHTNSDEEI
jgi:hypothetical protein